MVLKIMFRPELGRTPWELLTAFVAGFFFCVRGLISEFAGFRLTTRRLMIATAIVAIGLAYVPSSAHWILFALFAPAVLTYVAMVRRIVLILRVWPRARRRLPR
jgi:hypothetical protein